MVASAATLPHPRASLHLRPRALRLRLRRCHRSGYRSRLNSPRNLARGLSIKLQPQRRKRYCGLGRRRGAPLKTPRRTAERLARRGFGRRTVRLLVITLNKYRTVSRARQADGFRSAANLSVDELKDSTFSACVTKVYGLASVFSELKHKLSGTGDVPHEGNKGAAEVRAKIQKTARLQTYSNHHEMTFFVYPSQRSLTQCCAPLVSDCVGHPTTHASHSLSVCSANPAPHFALFDL